MKLKSEIEDVFSEVPYPGDDNLVEKAYPEYLEAAAVFKGIRWQDWKECPREFLLKATQNISFLSPAAFRYYLPLYMIQCLVDYACSYPFPGEVITMLAPSSCPGQDFLTPRLQPLTGRQLSTIISFLEYMKRAHAEDLPAYPLDEAIKAVSAVLGNKNNQ